MTSSIALWSLLSLAAAVAEPDGRRVAHCGRLDAHPQGVAVDTSLSSALDRLIGAFARDTRLLPGLSIGVVKGDRLVYARGFGYADLDRCTPTTTRTRYYLKSVTKSFLGLGAALMHESGRIQLDAPIAALLPRIRLPEGRNPQLIPLRAHFTHTQPYWDGALIYRTAFTGNLPARDFVAHIARHSQLKDVGFRYSNFGPIVGAHAVAAKTGVPWRALLQQHVFAPAGMTDSFTRIEAARGEALCTAYVGDEDKGFVETSIKTEAQMNAAGGAISTVHDLARWLIANLNHGQIDGRQVFARRAIERAHARSVSIDWSFQEIHRFATGLGVYSGDYEGELLMHHFGGESHVSFMPERGWAIVILTNNISLGIIATHRLALTVYDHLLGRTDVDARRTRRINDVSKDRLRRDKARVARHRAQMKKAGRGPTTLSATALVGRYRLPRLGEISISRREGRLIARFGELEGALEHAGGDAYRAELGLWGAPPLLFMFRRSGRSVALDWGGRVFERTN